MRTSRIRRAGSVNNGQFIFAKQRLEWGKTWMQPEESIEIDGAIRATATWFRNCDRRTHAVVILFAEWNHDVEAVSGAALK